MKDKHFPLFHSLMDERVLSLLRCHPGTCRLQLCIDESYAGQPILNRKRVKLSSHMSIERVIDVIRAALC